MDLMENYYEDISFMDKTSYLYGKNIMEDTDYNQIKDYYFTSLKNVNYQKNEGDFLGQTGNGDKKAWAQHRNMKLLLRTQGNRNVEVPYKDGDMTFKSETEPQMESFDYKKSVEMSKHKAADITKRLYPDTVRQVLTESQNDPYTELIHPLIRGTIERKKPLLKEYMREFIGGNVNNNVLNLEQKKYKNINKYTKNDLEFFTSKIISNTSATVTKRLGDKTSYDLQERDIEKKNNIEIIVKNINNKPRTYVRMLWSDKDGKVQTLEFELSNTIAKIPQKELMNVLEEVLNEIQIIEFDDTIKKNNLGEKPKQEKIITVGEDLYFSKENERQLKHNLTEPNKQISVFLKRVITDIVKDSQFNISKDSKLQNNMKEAILWKIRDYCKQKNIEPSIIELLTKDSVLNKIQILAQRVNYANEKTNRFDANNNIKLQENTILGINQKSKFSNDINFSLNKDNILNNEEAQLIYWNEDFKQRDTNNIKRIPKEYDNSSKFLYNSMREKRSFNS